MGFAFCQQCSVGILNQRGRVMHVARKTTFTKKHKKRLNKRFKFDVVVAARDCIKVARPLCWWRIQAAQLGDTGNFNIV